MVDKAEITAKLNELKTLLGDLTGTGEAQMAVGAKLQEISALVDQL